MSDITPTPTSIQELQPKMELKGTVKKTELFGALVDIGIGRPGLVHISRLQKGRVKNVTDVVKVGDEVTVWVHKLEQEAGRVELTMVEPSEMDWSDLKEGQTVKGKVVRIEPYGAFVDVGAERPGLVHVSELAVGYVKSPNEVVNMGQEVEARVIGLDARKGRIDLSMKASEMEEIYTIEDDDDEEEGEVLTAFAAAFQRAQEGQQDEDEASAESKAASSQKARDKQEELLARTLAQHKGDG